MVVLLDRAGRSFTRQLQAAHAHSALGFIQRADHHMEQADDYEYLQAIAKHEIPLQEASGMLVQ